jgi:hypothetical protein
MLREKQDWKARTPRQTVSVAGVGLWVDGSTAPVLVSNLSYHGCHFWTDHELSIGEPIQLTLPGKGKVEGQIRWVRRGRAGVRFLNGASAADERRARLGI